jgi:Flp pilus assembly protein TadG/uncharacterized protein YegL
MTKTMERRSWLSRLLRDRRGNFGMMTALVFPVMLAAGGVAIDLTKMVMIKAELQDATDAAALAAASSLANDGKTAEQAKEIAMRFLKSQMTTGGSVDAEGEQEDKDKNDYTSSTKINVKETVLSGNGKSFQVDVATKYTLDFNPFTRLLGQKSADLNARSTAESGTAEKKHSISMFLVLDQSGSMSFITNEKDPDKNKKCQNHTSSNWYTANLKETSPCYISKIAALKTAVASLVTELNTADPEKKYVRTGAVSYNDKMLTTVDLAWGTATALAYVNAIAKVPQGGTDSSGAFAQGLKKVKDPAEETIHKNKSGQVPSRFILFMTDGENTHYNGVANDTKSDEETKKSCQAARDAKIEVYAVAFMAPQRGQDLLRSCATTGSNYFEATNMAALISAFKEIGSRTAATVARLTK